MSNTPYTNPIKQVLFTVDLILRKVEGIYWIYDKGVPVEKYSDFPCAETRFKTLVKQKISEIERAAYAIEEENI